MYYLHPTIAKSAELPLLKSLGVKTLNTQHLLEVGKSLMRSWSDSPEGMISNIKRRYHCTGVKVREDVLNTFTKLQLASLASGVFSFYPLGSGFTSDTQATAVGLAD